MMASAGLAPGGNSLTGIGIGHHGPVSGRQDVSSLPRVPGTGIPAAGGASSGSGPPKKFFSSSTDEISEASLAEGFSFPSMQALRQGQLSNPIASDSCQDQPESPRVSPVNRPSTKSPPENIVSPFFKKVVALDPIRAAPPEELVAKFPSDNGQQQSKRLQPLGPDPAHSPRNISGATQNQGSNSALRRRIQNLKNMSRHSGPGAEPPKTIPIDKPTSSPPKGSPPKHVEHIDLTEKPSPKTAHASSAPHASPPKLTTSAALQEAMRGVTDAPRMRDKLKTPDLVPLHSRRRSQLDHFGSPAPFRDLTSSARPSPALSKRYSRSRFDNRPISQERDRMSRHGSQPRMSGILKKRSSDHRHGPRSELDRKKAAMYQVAQYWNECIRIAEEEKAQANLEIDKLSDELCRQDHELQELRANSDRKDRKLRDTEGVIEKLFGEKGRADEENNTLRHDLESLRTQLSESKEQSQSLANDVQSCRDELKKANQEQQALTSLFEESQKMIDALRKEKDNVAADSDALVKTIDEGRMKREQLEKSVEELRAEAQQGLVQKEQIISELKAKVEKFEAEVILERDSSSRLRAQIDNELNSCQIVRQLEIKMDSLLAASATVETERQKEHDERAAVIDIVQEKLDSILTAFNMSSASTLTLPELEHKLQTLKEEVLARILPTISSVSIEHTGIGAAISELHTSVESQIGALHENLNQQGDESRVKWQVNQDQANESARLLQLCGDALNSSRQVCQEVGLRVDAWLNNERQACQDAANVSLTDAQEQLKESGEKIKALEEKLELAQDAHAANLEALGTKILDHGEGATAAVQNAAAGLRVLVEEEMNTIKEMTERMISLNADTNAAFMTHLKETKDRLGSLDDGGSCDGTGAREPSEALKLNETIVTDLKSRIQELEDQAKTHGKLGERWRQDMKDLEVIRRKYKMLLERAPMIQGLGAKIDRVVELNTSIQSTSQYLASETAWIGDQLQCQKESQGAEKTPNTSNWGGAVASESVNTPASVVPNLKPEVSAPCALKEVAFRRVTVHSPAPRNGSPDSPDPPSVKQEQKRRREAIQVRPILKQHTAPTRGSNYQPVDFSHLLAQHTRINGQSLAASQSTGIVASTTYTNVARQRGYHFPTLADFESSTQGSNGEEQSCGSKHALFQADDDEGQDVKKRKRE